VRNESILILLFVARTDARGALAGVLKKRSTVLMPILEVGAMWHFVEGLLSEEEIAEVVRE
jgi:hypothetical protein